MRFHLVGQLFRGGPVSNPILAPDGSAALPSYSFVSDPDTGFFTNTGGQIIFSANGTSRWRASPGDIQLQSTLAFAWSSGAVQGTTDLSLFRDAANTFAQRNGVNAQAFRIYNTYTDTNNYERVFFSWSSNVFRIGQEATGTGTQRDLAVGPSPAQELRFTSGGSIVFTGFVGFGSTGGIGIGATPSAAQFILVGASLATKAHIRLTAGVAPTSPNDGDIWFDGTNLCIRIDGVTYNIDRTAV